MVTQLIFAQKKVTPFICPLSKPKKPSTIAL